MWGDSSLLMAMPSIGLEHQIEQEHESRYLSDVDISQFDEIISFSLDAFQEVERLDLPSAEDCSLGSGAGIGHNRDDLRISRPV